jgi:hypothetical protein
LLRTGISYILMVMAPQGRVFRRIARVLATVQLLAFAVAPMLEAYSVARQAGNVVSVENANPRGSVAPHDSASCAACQLLRVAARLPDTARIPFDRAIADRPTERGLIVPPRFSPNRGLHSRAPPLRLV